MCKQSRRTLRFTLNTTCKRGGGEDITTRASRATPARRDACLFAAVDDVERKFFELLYFPIRHRVQALGLVLDADAQTCDQPDSAHASPRARR
jgi:hypothetical protein